MIEGGGHSSKLNSKSIHYTNAVRRNTKNQKRILAIYPSSRGFGFSVLEGRDRLIDWGVVQTKDDKHRRTIARVTRFMARYTPDEVVTEDPMKSPYRSARIRKLLAGVQDLAVMKRVQWRGVSRGQVRETFRTSGPVTKYRIAQGIAGHFPELASRLPPPRKPWMSEDARMAIFDAVAVALTVALSNKPALKLDQ